MAPARSATRAKASEADYSNVGVAGRKTGIVLKDSGVRDEHGMEPIDGIFSSPEKPPSTRKRKSANHTITSESEMEIGHSTIPDPTDVLRPGRPSLPPPRSRSPMKTNLGSPARRSVGFSSPLRQPAVRSSPLASDSPSRHRPKPAASAMQGSRLTRRPVKKRSFELSASDGEEEVVVEEEDQDQDNEEAADKSDVSMPDVDEVPELNGEDFIQVPADESMDIPKSDTEDEAPPVAKRGRGRPKKGKTQEAGAGKGKIANGLPRKRGRPRKHETATTDARPAKRVKKTATRPVTPDADARDADVPEASTRNGISTPEQNSMKPPPAKRGPNARSKPLKGMADNQITWAGTDRTKPRARGLRILRSETPAEDLGATVMRSGRTSVKPMAYWRNERMIYGTGRVGSAERELGGIKEVIRTEEITPDRQPRRHRRGGRRPRIPEAIEDDEDVEEWETEPGFLEATVPRWDPRTGKTSEEEEEEIELAYAPKGLELATREVKGATFLYGKTLSLPFFHSGIVDLPPGGEKRPKNSRVNHIVFWVFAGRVDVNVSNNEFSIGRGGMWQVPRGNFYSLHNSYDRPARVFFAQGCYMQEEEGS